MDSRIYILTHKRLTDQLSSMEEAELSGLMENPQNLSISNELSYLWQASNHYFPQRDWGKDAAKKAFYDKISTPATPISIASPINTGVPGWARMLALLLLLCLGGLIMYKMMAAPKQIKVDPIHEYAQIFGDTKVWVSNGAELTIIEDSKQARKVSLAGQAFFDVAHEPERPLTIDLGKGIFAEVLGTSFVARSAHSGASGMVSVQNGSVKLYDIKDPEATLILTVGQKGELHPTHGGSIMMIEDLRPIMPLKEQIAFNATPLTDVFDDLEEIYKVDFDFDKEAIAACKYSNILAPDALLSETLNSIELVHQNIDIVQHSISSYTVHGSCE